MTEVFILPGLALLFAIISLFIEPKEIKKRAKRLAILGSMTLILVLIFGFTVKSNLDANAQLNETQRELEKITSTQDQVVVNTEIVIEILRNGGFPLEKSERIEQSLEASKTIERKKESPLDSTSIERRSSITIEYFPKDVDRKIVEANLKRLGFQLVEGTPNFQAATNSIWFGRDVVTDDVKLIALNLIRAGIQIQAIRPFSNPLGSKASKVQVGSDLELDSNCKPWTVKAIEEASSFTRRNNGCMF